MKTMYDAGSTRPHLTGVDFAHHRRRTVTEQVKDRVRLLQRIGLWKAMAWGVGFLCLWDGSGYFVRGNAIAQGQALKVLRNVPGGLHLHGAIMLILACAIFYTSHDRARQAHYVFLVVWAYSVWVSISIIAGWVLYDQIVWSGPSKWFLVAWISLFLAATTERARLTPIGK